MSNEIRDILTGAGLFKSLLPRDQLRRDRIIDETFERGGGFREDARRTILAPYPLSWSLPGIVFVGLNQGGARRVPTPSLLTRLDVLAQTAPTSTLEIVLYRWPNGGSGFVATTVAVSLSTGAFVGGDTSGLTLNAGDWLAITITSAGGAGDVDVQASLTPM